MITYFMAPRMFLPTVKAPPHIFVFYFLPHILKAHFSFSTNNTTSSAINMAINISTVNVHMCVCVNSQRSSLLNSPTAMYECIVSPHALTYPSTWPLAHSFTSHSLQCERSVVRYACRCMYVCMYVYSSKLPIAVHSWCCLTTTHLLANGGDGGSSSSSSFGKCWTFSANSL
ncbi:unnamed protein product [Ceratitis capitata]|uniref:(Mediterranean fruit fly) hypothetical protein n=1 Tax=Ceratitis capitata TaxID=7213 RepID=A0A811UNN7_CERCA|nr:unnamed protein product [Ceratitis capitata]